ncbi:hypothetical protein KUTeg_012766 [Tegillarca granosa]|uniref:Uncharacterized protein n=1 Tax=Tegillarca granosa TaxID=220873 RepID=A0ABQ9F3X8_TEGGR|nr:hypothetical protein KUTeg_012766 [Tegillarca granosa]
MAPINTWPAGLVNTVYLQNLKRGIATTKSSKMIRGGGRARKREYDQDSSYRDRDDFQSKRARGSYSSRGSYSNTSPRGSRGSWYSSSPRGSSSRGSTFRSDSRGSSRSETRGSFRSDSRGSFRSDTRGSYKTSYDSSSSRGSYNSDSRGSYRTSDSRGSYRGSASTRGSYNSDSRGSYRISDSRGSYRGSASSRGDRRSSFGDNLGGSHTKRSTSTGSRGRGSFRSFDRSPSREDFRSPSSDYRRIRKFSGDREDFRGSRSPSFNRNLRDTNSGSRYMEEKYHSKDRRFVGGSGGFRGSFKQRFPRERSSRPPYSRGRGSSQFRGRGRGSFEHRQRQFRKSPSLGRSYHGSDASDEIKTGRGGKYFRRHRRHSDCPESSYFSDDEEDQEDDKDRYPEFETLTEVKPEEENEMKKRDLAGIILRLLMDEGGHMKVHDLEMELITSKNIQFSTSDDFEKFLSDNKEMVKGKKRRVKQTKRVKQPSGSDGAGEKQPSGDDSVPEKQPSGNDSAGEIMKSLAVWQVSYASQEEWKEYKVDFSTLEGTTDIENEEDEYFQMRRKKDIILTLDEELRNLFLYIKSTRINYG